MKRIVCSILFSATLIFSTSPFVSVTARTIHPTSKSKHTHHTSRSSHTTQKSVVRTEGTVKGSNHHSRRTKTHTHSHSAHGGNQVPLPQEFAQLDNIYVQQFRVHQQQGSTCGSHAMFNAIAVQELFEGHHSISPKRVKEKAEHYFPNMRDKEYLLNFEDMCELGNSLQLKNTHLVAYNQDLNQLYSGGTFNATPDFDQFTQEIRNSRNMLAQFIFNYSEHWVTVSVIKHHNHTRIIHLNSTNAPLVEESLAYQFIEELCGRLM